MSENAPKSKISMMIDKIRKLIPKTELDYLVDIDRKQSMVVNLSGLSIGLGVCVIGFSWYLSRDTIVHEERPVYVCPANYDMDTDVPMKTLDQLSDREYKRLAVGMIRNYIAHQFMRAPEDAESSLDYLVEHSKNAVRKRYVEYRDNIEEIKQNLMSNQRMRFYKKLATDVRFPRSVGSRFVVEIDGFIIREKGTKEEFQTVTLRYMIERGARTEGNAQGLYVSFDEIVVMKDAVANEKTVEDGI